MIKRLLALAILIAFSVSCFAGYSSGARSGYSSGARSYSRSYSAPSRSYSAPNRSYSRSSSYYSGSRRSYSGSNTVVNNHHYGSTGFGGGFFGGMMGGMFGSALMNGHHTTVMAGGNVAPMVGTGEGMYMEPGAPVVVQRSGTALGDVLMVVLIGLVAFAIIASIIGYLIDQLNSDRRYYK